MRAFPNLHDVYEAWKKHIEERGAVVRLSTEVTEVVQRKKGKVVLKVKKVDDEATSDATEETLEFDEMIMAVDADSALKVLGKQASWKERKILGNVKYFWDISVTHYDKEYMKKVRNPSAFPARFR
jgi:predicted NAD/FAD-binding protein